MGGQPKIRFGTDGWRGVIGEDFTFSRVRLLAQAIANYLSLQSPVSSLQSVVVGYDTRHLSKEFAGAVARVLARNGISVFLSNSFAPTPAFSYAVVEKKAMGAVIITASHNPPQYNGLKFKSSSGGSATFEVTSAIEDELNSLQSSVSSLQSSTMNRQPSTVNRQPQTIHHSPFAIHEFDPKPAYFKRLAELVNLECIASSGIEVFLDPMYGATQGYLSGLLRDLGLKVGEIHAMIDPSFGGINPEPLLHNLGELSALLRPQTSDLRPQSPVFNHEPSTVNRELVCVGFAFDGDGDRIGAVDEEGNFVNPHQIFALLLKHLVINRGLTGVVVKNFATTRMVDRLAQKYGLPLHETPIGFKYIAGHMEREKALIGGEESGGFGIQGHIPERDGILCALLLLEMMATEGKSLGQLVLDLEREVGPHRFGRLDLELQNEVAREEIAQLLASSLSVRPDGFELEMVQDLDGTKLLFQDGSWLLLRPSGTEPVLRIYAEAPSDEGVSRLLDWGKTLASGLVV